MGDDATKTIALRDINRETRQFTAESFFDTRRYFVMIAPKTRLRGGRRIRVVAS